MIRMLFVFLDAVCMVYVISKVTHAFKTEPFLYKKSKGTPASDNMTVPGRNDSSTLGPISRVNYITRLI